MGLGDLRRSALMLLLLMSALGQAYEDAGYFDGLYDGYNVSEYLVSSGRLGRAAVSRQRRGVSGVSGVSGRPRRRAFSVGLFGVPEDTTLRFQLQVVRPFASEYTEFLDADQFKTEWYASLRYKVHDLQASAFRKFQGPGRVNTTAAYHMMNATTQMMRDVAAAAAAYEPVTEEMSSMSSTEQQQQQQGETEGMVQHSQYGEQPERYWTRHDHQASNAVPWYGYVDRQGEIDNRVDRQGEIDNHVDVEDPDAELLDAQMFRVEQKMKIYQRMEQMYKRQGQDGAECVMRVICEVAEAPMEDGVLGDVVNLLVSATNGVEDLLHAKWLDKRYRPYLEAHMYGEMRGDCAQRYSGCTLSLIDPTTLAFF